MDMLARAPALLFVSESLGASDAVSSNAVAWRRVLEIQFDEGGFVFRAGPALLVAAATIAASGLLWLCLRGRLAPGFEVVEAELEIANLGKVTIKPNRENAQIAHEAWAELVTRKAAVPFDEEHDVIAEVYDSYYHLFSRLRDLTKRVPAHKLRNCRDTRALVDVMVAVLNRGLRPHLTAWQARFRRWYLEALKEPANRSKSPQEIQKEFPEYGSLVADLKVLQADVVRYGEFLRQVAQGKHN